MFLPRVEPVDVFPVAPEHKRIGKHTRGPRQEGVAGLGEFSPHRDGRGAGQETRQRDVASGGKHHRPDQYEGGSRRGGQRQENAQKRCHPLTAPRAPSPRRVDMPQKNGQRTSGGDKGRVLTAHPRRKPHRNPPFPGVPEKNRKGRQDSGRPIHVRRPGISTADPTKVEPTPTRNEVGTEHPPEDLVFEGAGDVLYDTQRGFAWAGSGQRSTRASHRYAEDVTGCPLVSLTLVNPSYYHLDTCLCPLPGGELLYYPPAFNEESLALIAAHTEPKQRIPVDDYEAGIFACNTVAIDHVLVVHGLSERLRRTLEEVGYQIEITPLDEFHKAGGSARCLTLCLTTEPGDSA